MTFKDTEPYGGRQDDLVKLFCTASLFIHPSALTLTH
jgi:hypothetical protein